MRCRACCRSGQVAAAARPAAGFTDIARGRRCSEVAEGAGQLLKGYLLCR